MRLGTIVSVAAIVAVFCSFTDSAKCGEVSGFNGFSGVASGCGCQSCNSCTRGCSAAPYPEGYRGPGLYWHNPCNCQSDPCGLPNCPTTQVPTWYAGAEFVALIRDSNSDRRFQVNGTTGVTELSESRLRPEFDAGTRAVLGRSIGDWYRLETSYLGTFSWNDDAAVRNLDANGQAGSAGGNLMSPFSDFGNPAVAGLDYNNFASVRFTSDLESVEVNLRRRVRFPMPHNTFYDRTGQPSALGHRAETSFLVGLRYISLEEEFGYATQSDVPAGGANNQVSVSADNAMFGVQIGMLSQFMCYAQKGWLDFEIKGGIYNNEIDISSAYLNSDSAGATITAFSDSDSRDKTSFVGELSLNYNHRVLNCCTFRVGYNAVWMSHVALASDNVNNDIGLLSLGPAQARHDGDVVMHGPSLGFIWSH